MSTDLKGAISSAISQANDKAAQKSEGSFKEQVARDRVSMANNRISVAESKVTRQQGEMAKIEEMLSPPPTKDVSEGGKNGGTKTVVDQEEVKRLNSKKTGIQQQITQAQQEVTNAQQEAQNAASEAIAQSGINAETQNEMDALLAKASNIKETLSEGGNVEDNEIKDLVDRFGAVAGELTQEQNKAGVLSKSFYEPMAEAFEGISDLLDPSDAATENATEVAENTDEVTTNSTSEDDDSTDSSEVEDAIKETTAAGN